MSAPDVREALNGIKALSLQHHAHEDSAVLLHALLVEIPAAVDALRAALAAPVSPDEATLTEYLSRCRPGTTREEAARDLGMTPAPVSPPAPRGEAVRHRPGHRPPVGFNAVVEIVSTSDLVADDVIFAEGRWLCVIDDGINDSTQVMAAEIIDDAAGQGLADTTYGEWFARVVALVPRKDTPNA